MKRSTRYIDWKTNTWKMVILKNYMKVGGDRFLYICYQNAYWLPNIYIQN